VTVLFNSAECRVLGYGVIARGNASAHERVGVARSKGLPRWRIENGQTD